MTNHSPEMHDIEDYEEAVAHYDDLPECPNCGSELVPHVPVFKMSDKIDVSAIRTTWKCEQCGYIDSHS